MYRPLAGADGLVLGEDLAGAALFGVGVVPADLQGVAALPGGPGILRQHGDAGGDLHHFHDARDLARGAVVEACDLAAEARRVGDHGDQQVRRLDVLGVAGLAGGLGRGVLAPDALGPDQGEALRILQHRRLRRRHAGGLGDQLAETGLAPGGRVADHAVLDRDLGGRDTPLRRRGLHEHGPRRCARRAHLGIGAGDGRGAAGALHAELGVGVELRVGRGVLEAHLVPIGVELLGDEGADADVVALAHLQELVDDRDAAVRRDLHEGAERADRQAEALGLGLGVRRDRADDQGAADHGGADQELAAAGFKRLERRVHPAGSLRRRSRRRPS